MALWKAGGGSLNERVSNLDHGIVEGRGGSLNRRVQNLDHGIVEGRGVKFK